MPLPTPHREADALRGWRTDALVFLGAAIPRCLYLFFAPRQFLYEHWDLAGSLLQHGTLGFDGVPTTRFEPLYPLLVAALRALTDDRVLVAQAVQVAIGSLAAVCLFRLVEALTCNRRSASIAAAMFAIYPLSIRHAADGTDVTLMATLVIAACWLFVASTTARGAALAGAVLGLAVLTRTMILPVVGLAALLLLRERRARESVALVAAAVAVFAPYAFRNHALNGAILPARTGVNLLVSNSEYTPALVPRYHADLLEAHAESLLVRDGIGSSGTMTPALERQQDLALTRHAWTEMKAHPIALVTRRAEYVLYFLWPVLVPSHVPGADADLEVQLEAGGRVRVSGYVERPLIEHIVHALSYGPLLLLGVFGLIARRTRHRREAILWCVAGTFVAAHSIFFPATRYRVPIDFVLIYYAAVELDRLAGRWWPARIHVHAESA